MKRILVGSLFALSSLAYAETPIRFCDDEGGYAPYSYNPINNGIVDKTTITGAIPDLLKEISKITKIAHTLEYIPWKRCMQEAAHFTADKKNSFEGFPHATFNEERGQLYYATAPIYRTHLGIFYNSEQYTDIHFATTAELNNSKICGIAGYNFDMFYNAGLNKGSIDLGAKDTKQAIEKLIAKRCDYFVTSIEVVYGGVATGQFTFPPNIKSYALPDLPSPTFHLFISKQSPRAYALLTELNQAIITLNHNGKSQEIFKKYLPGGNGL